MIETIVNPKDPQIPYPKEKWREGGDLNDSKIIMPPHYNKIFSLRNFFPKLKISINICTGQPEQKPFVFQPEDYDNIATAAQYKHFL